MAKNIISLIAILDVPHEPSDDDTLYYTVTNLHPNSNYRLRVRAENELGTSEPSPESGNVQKIDHCDIFSAEPK